MICTTITLKVYVANKILIKNAKSKPNISKFIDQNFNFFPFWVCLESSYFAKSTIDKCKN